MLMLLTDCDSGTFFTKSTGPEAHKDTATHSEGGKEVKPTKRQAKAGTTWAWHRQSRATLTVPTESPYWSGVLIVKSDSKV